MSFKKIFFPLAKYIVRFTPGKRRKVKHFLRDHSVVKLQLGSGENILPGWLNIDLSVSVCRSGAIYMDVGERFLLPNESWTMCFQNT